MVTGRAPGAFFTPPHSLFYLFSKCLVKFRTPSPTDHPHRPLATPYGLVIVVLVPERGWETLLNGHTYGHTYRSKRLLSAN